MTPVAEATQTEAVASGGAGTLEHFREATDAGVTILLAASVLHFGIIRIPQLKWGHSRIAGFPTGQRADWKVGDTPQQRFMDKYSLRQ